MVPVLGFVHWQPSSVGALGFVQDVFDEPYCHSHTQPTLSESKSTTIGDTKTWNKTPRPFSFTWQRRVGVTALISQSTGMHSDSGPTAFLFPHRQTPAVMTNAVGKQRGPGAGGRARADKESSAEIRRSYLHCSRQMAAKCRRHTC